MGDSTFAPAGLGGGERKQITAVFLDIVGFSQMASTADAEDLQQWLEDFYGQCDRLITSHGGEVTEYHGDGVVALFGHNHADELAASKAVMASTLALESIDKSGADGREIQLRVGIASGEAAVRADTRKDTLPRVTGTVTTLARRVQEMAEPGGLLVSESTQDLLRGAIAVEALPDQALKGFEEPQTLYRPLPDRQAVPLAAPLGFVGRKAEIDLIATSNLPCLIVGQAGIGKTALVRHLAAGTANVTWLSADGVRMQASYQPFVRWITSLTPQPLPDFADLSALFPALAAENLQIRHPARVVELTQV